MSRSGVWAICVAHLISFVVALHLPCKQGAFVTWRDANSNNVQGVQQRHVKNPQGIRNSLTLLPRLPRLPRLPSSSNHHVRLVRNSLATLKASLSWSQVESLPALEKARKHSAPVYLHELPPQVAQENLQRPTPLPILYRDEECICAASQTMWLGLECKNAEYLTVLLRRNESFGETLDSDHCARIVWPGGEAPLEVADAVRALEEIEARLGDVAPAFYPKLSAAVDASRCNIMRFSGVMPRNSAARLMSAAPFLVLQDGGLVAKASHCVSLEELDELLEEYYLGPFLCGRHPTAADIVWAPYLERYAVQLPLLFPDNPPLDPRAGYGELREWYLAMERQLPAYSCCVQGDARHWRAQLEHVAQHYKHLDLAPKPSSNKWWLKINNPNAHQLWQQYSSTRPYLADTPEAQASLYLTQNRQQILAKINTMQTDISESQSQETLLQIVNCLLLKEKSNANNDIVNTLTQEEKQILELVIDTISVPKDMPMIPIMSLASLL